MREDVSFGCFGDTVRGWYWPGRPGTRSPAILMAHGLSAVKEQRLAPFAEAFAAAGFAVLVIDFRCLGASDGEPRGQVIAQRQHDDLRAALAWLSARPDVDRGRIGLWGTSFSGGHALFLGGLDPRVGAVVAQVPAVSVARCFEALVGVQAFAGLLQMLSEEQAARASGGEPAAIPVVDAAGGAQALGTPDAIAWFLDTAREAPGWVNSITLESVARAVEYVPETFIERIAPRPLLVIAAEQDSLIPVEFIRAAMARAGEPKRLEVWPCGHFDLYQTEPWHGRAVAAARDWFVAALRP
jgi:hypothetical protein